MNTSKQINIIVALVFAAVLATGAYTLWDPSRSSDAEERQEEKLVERGAFWFSQNCRVCHGDSGEGGVASNRLAQAPVLNRPELQGRPEEGAPIDEKEQLAQYRRIYFTISCGRVGTAMPTWSKVQGGPLTDEQIRQITIMITRGTGWEQAKEFGLRGATDFGVHGDDVDGYHLVRAVDASTTEVFLTSSKVDLARDGLLLAANDRLEIDGELLSVTEVNHSRDIKETNDQGTVTKTTHDDSVIVVRGLGRTNPAAHDEGAEVLKSPVPPNPPAINGADGTPPCGQRAPATAGGTPGAETPTAAAGCTAPATTLEITAPGIAFDKSTLCATAGQPLTVTFHNQDRGTLHNFAVFTNQAAAEGGENPLAATELQAGPVDETLQFGPLVAGEFYYHCDAHPTQMNGTLTVQ